MRRSALPILVVACVIVAAVLAWLVVQKFFASSAPADSGPVTSEIRTPGPFTKIDANGHMDIEIVQGPRHEVQVEAAPGQLDHVRTRRRRVPADDQRRSRRLASVPRNGTGAAHRDHGADPRGDRDRRHDQHPRRRARRPEPAPRRRRGRRRCSSTSSAPTRCVSPGPAR